MVRRIIFGGSRNSRGKKALQEKQHTEFLFLKIDLKLYCDFFANND